MTETVRYRCGMYGGSFNPPHLGHVRCLIQAAAQCEQFQGGRGVGPPTPYPLQ